MADVRRLKTTRKGAPALLCSLFFLWTILEELAISVVLLIKAAIPVPEPPRSQQYSPGILHEYFDNF
jgi:hypothetical protein